ncbi:uncharacterized protein PV09_07335 [Verruconis gallopava]|uniref:F-box domain-containing protein n=1 Tax=Verruconis gallopava TaxID=253628 RepID=A0A0D1XGG3_9PEZI|nr:uncharacterized protein PV09_07335 [Verruconis gallopava]KIW01296.1 hypothetical protein PV09_07335 [Verruconis gallopava]
MSLTAASTTDGARKAPVLTLSARDYFHSTPESRFFSIPLEIRQQIYRYVFYTPNTAFQRTIKGWRETPHVSDLTYGVNNTALNAVSRRIRAEALPIMYGETKFRIEGPTMFRRLLYVADLSDCKHMYIRKVSLVAWKKVLNQGHLRSSALARQGSILVSILAELPCLKEVELSSGHLPATKEDYNDEYWIALMYTLRANTGVLRIVAATIKSNSWWFDWSLVGGHNYSWQERVLVKTCQEVRDWNELVNANLGAFEFSNVFEEAMRESWMHGPFKHVAIEHEGKTYAVKFWGVPENVRMSE